MVLQHRTFYMPHYAIGLFLEAVASQIPVDDFEESTSAEVGGETAGGPSFFAPPQLSTSVHLTTSTSVIPSFGQRHAPVVMIPPAVSETLRAMTEMIPWVETGVVPQVVAEVVPPPVTDILPTGVAEGIPIVLAEHVSHTAGVTVPGSQGTELCVPEPQVRLKVFDCDAVFTVSSSLLPEAKPVEPLQQEQTMQPAQLERLEVMDRASMFLR